MGFRQKPAKELNINGGYKQKQLNKGNFSINQGKAFELQINIKKKGRVKV